MKFDDIFVKSLKPQTCSGSQKKSEGWKYLLSCWLSDAATNRAGYWHALLMHKNLKHRTIREGLGRDISSETSAEDGSEWWKKSMKKWNTSNVHYCCKEAEMLQMWELLSWCKSVLVEEKDLQQISHRNRPKKKKKKMKEKLTKSFLLKITWITGEECVSKLWSWSFSIYD